jgi:hypothetical protein
MTFIFRSTLRDGYNIAIGRALAGLGYGTQFCEGESEADSGRIVDAPVERKPSYDPNAPATPQQFDTAHRLQKQLGLTESDFDGLSFGDMATMIRDLSKRVQDKRKVS